MMRTLGNVMGQFTPSLNLDFTTGVMPSGLTFTRNSVGTYFDANGVMQTAIANMPRFDYDPVTLQLKGLLIEESRTNFILRSAELDNATWNKVQTTATTNAVNGPDGTLSAEKIVQTNTNARHFVTQVFTCATATNYTLSVYAKAAELNRISVVSDNTNSTPSFALAAFNLTNGTILSTTSGATSTIQSVGNGWYRCTMTVNSNTLTSFQYSIILGDGFPAVQGDGVSGLYLWGVQAEAGSFATSYIPTTTAAVTRATDACSMLIGSWFNQNEGTLFMVGSQISDATASRGILSIVGPTSGNRITIYRQATTKYIRGYVNSSGVGAGYGATAINENTQFKALMGYRAGFYSIAVNNTIAFTSATTPLAYTTLYLGVSALNVEPSCVYFQKVVYYPHLLPNTYSQYLTN